MHGTINIKKRRTEILTAKFGEQPASQMSLLFHCMTLHVAYLGAIYVYVVCTAAECTFVTVTHFLLPTPVPCFSYYCYIGFSYHNAQTVHLLV